MERTISDEEKIRRAIEISQRRNRTYSVPTTAKVNVSNKKDYGLFRKMILQIIICLLIYFIFYLITTTNYIFSDDVIKQTSSILNYDINFHELYQKGLNGVKGFISQSQEQNNTENNNEVNQVINNSISDNLVSSNNVANIVNAINVISVTEEEPKKVANMTQEEKDVKTIKEKYKLIKPLDGTVTSEFGGREATSPIMSADHKGIDIAAEKGKNIKAANSGQVEEASSNSEYGNFIKIKDGDLLTVYAHCEKLKVSKGDKVKKGDVIATVGSTGKSTGPHLHFEIRLSGRYINPRLIIEF